MQLEYLGHLVGDGKMSVPEAKVRAIMDYKQPVTTGDLRSYLGLMGYYRKIIKGFAEIAKPLYQLIRKDAPKTILWTGEALSVFSKLSVSLCHACVLHLPVSSDHFILQTDASYVGLSGCLSVLRSEQELPVAFYSRQLKPAETRYTVSEIECLAAVEAIRHFLVYLDGHNFTLETDHSALEYLLSARLTNKRLIRWALQLQGLHFTIRHRSGAKNDNADGLSRQAWIFQDSDLRFQGSGISGLGLEPSIDWLPGTAPPLRMGILLHYFNMHSHIYRRDFASLNAKSLLYIGEWHHLNSVWVHCHRLPYI